MSKCVIWEKCGICEIREWEIGDCMSKNVGYEKLGVKKSGIWEVVSPAPVMVKLGESKLIIKAFM